MTSTDAFAAALGVASPLLQPLGRIAFSAAVVSLLSLLALHVLKPDLHPSWHMVSEYAVGPHGWVMTLCFAALALGCVTLAAALVVLRPSVLGWIGVLLLLGTTVGLTMAAMFPTDPITVAPADASPTARMHALAVLIGNLSFILAALVVLLGLWGNAAWEGVRVVHALVTVLIWLSLAAMIAIAVIVLPKAGGFGPDVVIGWPNRALMVAYAAWIMTAAWPIAWSR